PVVLVSEIDAPREVEELPVTDTVERVALRGFIVGHGRQLIAERRGGRPGGASTLGRCAEPAPSGPAAAGPLRAVAHIRRGSAAGARVDLRFRRRAGAV